MKPSIGDQLLQLFRKDWDQDTVTFLGMSLAAVLLMHLVAFPVRASLPVAVGGMAAACLLDASLAREMHIDRREYLSALPVPACLLATAKLLVWLGAFASCALLSVLIGLSGIDAMILRSILGLVPQALHPMIVAALEGEAVYGLGERMQLFAFALGLLPFGIIGMAASVFARLGRVADPRALFFSSLVLVFTGLVLVERFRIGVSLPALFMSAALLDGSAMILLTTTFYRNPS